MGEGNTRENIETEAEWIESTLMRSLDKHANQITGITRSKIWKTQEVEAKQNYYGGTRRLYQQGRFNAFTLNAESNSYYYTIRRAKKASWATFLQGLYEILVDSERC